MDTSFKNMDTVKNYLNHIRGGIPFGPTQMELMSEILKLFVHKPQRALDLGCGDGILSEFLLRLYPQLEIICIDHSDAMLSQAKIRLAPYASQVQFVLADLSSMVDKPEHDNRGVDITISGYAIHHLPNSLKYKLYSSIYTWLNPNGIFLNMEHTASVSPLLETLHDTLFVNFLADHTKQDRDEVEKSYRNRTDQYDNILEHVQTQTKWLTEIGFRHVDCYFKYMELALFGGVK